MGLFAKGDVVISTERFDARGNELRPGSIYYDYYSKTIKREYQIGSSSFRKRKLLEINSPLVEEVELYDYRKGEIVIIDANKLREGIISGKFNITGREKKKFKL